MNDKTTKVTLEKIKTMTGNTHWAKLLADEKAVKKPSITANKKPK